jgi:hypothetical protein
LPVAEDPEALFGEFGLTADNLVLDRRQPLVVGLQRPNLNSLGPSGRRMRISARHNHGTDKPKSFIEEWLNLAQLAIGGVSAEDLMCDLRWPADLMFE